jgi:hypothetical protein
VEVETAEMGAKAGRETVEGGTADEVESARNDAAVRSRSCLRVESWRFQ